MTSFLTVVLALLALALLVPAGTLLVQCLSAMLPMKPNEFGDRPAARPRLAVLVPAHDEAAVIAATLRSIAGQLQDGDRLLVVADNCTDQTAQVASAHGALVLERNDPDRRGKGFALEWGLESLRTNPPQVVIVVDADCTLEDDCLDRLACQAEALGRPAQAAYLMPPPAGARPADVISSLAVLIKNRVRPRGMARLGLPCLLTGSGMAFPWPIIETATLAGDNIVEDMQLSIDLSRSGNPPCFCDRAVLTAPLPVARQAARRQRTRWEHGHLRTVLAQAPRLLAALVRQRKGHLLATALDLSVPPLSLLVMLWSVATGFSTAFGLWTHVWLPAALCGLSGAMLVMAVGLAWLRFARWTVPLTVLLSIPAYLIWKLPVYAAFLFTRQRTWVRTERGGE